MPDWNPKANELFLDASEIDSLELRDRFLSEHCAGDETLHRQVLSLLRISEETDVLEGQAKAEIPLRDMTAMERPVGYSCGAKIGPYKILQEIGEGGFGLVYMAEQQAPISRRVALKIIKPGMDSRDVIGRFEAERQALAMMDHPNIAKVLDAGATEVGQPYFIMELVSGVPITEFCDENNFGTHQRLKLFESVCNAVQHAHQKGVIHRDIKPSNVMITLHDGQPVVKVIDFGIAKALSRQLTEKTFFTQYGQMVGTPQYMSPEQAEMSGLGVDTRSDIYSLGVLLYELLTGTTPLDAKELRSAGYAEMIRLIKDAERPKPSVRLSTLGESLSIVCERRGTDQSLLCHSLTGDLDCIVMKAVEKDRDRRYETASCFLEDIERFLHDQPIEARPPSKKYLVGKFVRRNRGAVATALAVLAALLLGLAGTIWGWRNAVQAQREIREYLLDEAFVHAMSGDEIRTSDFIQKLDIANAREADVEMIRGLLLRVDNPEQALEHFNHATELDETSVAAWSLRAQSKFLLDGGGGDLVKAESLPCRTRLDYLLLAEAISVRGTPNATVRAKSLYEASLGMRASPLTKLLFAENLARHAVVTKNQKEMVQAVKYLGAGKSLLGTNFWTSLLQMNVCGHAVFLANSLNDVDETRIESLTTVAKEAAAELDRQLQGRKHMAVVHFQCAMHFDLIEGAEEKAESHWMRAPTAGMGYPPFLLKYKGDSGLDRAVEELRKVTDSVRDRALLSLLLAFSPGREEEAWQVWTEQHDAGEPQHPLAIASHILVPRLLGKQVNVMSEIRANKSVDSASSLVSLLALYLIGDKEESELLAFRPHTIQAQEHFFIGLKWLASGGEGRAKAREHFEKSSKRRSYSTATMFSSLSEGFLAQMNRDALWASRVREASEQ